MKVPTLTDNPYALSCALRRVEARERKVLRRRRRPPGFWRRLFTRHSRREHVVRLSPTEIITSNLL